jgi:hypothetical protein
MGAEFRKPAWLTVTVWVDDEKRNNSKERATVRRLRVTDHQNRDSNILNSFFTLHLSTECRQLQPRLRRPTPPNLSKTSRPNFLPRPIILEALRLAS